MLTDYEIVPAKRQGLKPLIGLYGKSGGGKTHSALLLARGIVGSEGKIVLIDTESGRGSIFSDLIPGGYDVLNLNPPFSPSNYIGAIGACDEADIVVIDSMSHEWSGEGGILDMHEAEFKAKSYKESTRMMCWIRPKMAHKKMVGEILRLKMPVICCLRGEEKTHSVQDAKTRKNIVVTDDFSTPIFDNKFIFELLINGEVHSNDKGEGGYLRIGKITHPDLRSCLPKDGEQLGIKHGEAMSKWCSAPGNPESAPAEETQSEPLNDETPDLKESIWESLKPIYKDEKTGAGKLKVATEWLREKGILKSNETLADACMDEEVMADIYAKIPIVLSDVV